MQKQQPSYIDFIVSQTTSPPSMAPRLFACFGRGSSSATAPDHPGEAALGPVLVELFSSQGCADSPAAEAVASRLGRTGQVAGVPVVVLEWHVEYWDYRGWKDPFGSSAWTVRQKALVEAMRLDSIYTPQTIVQGRTQCVGTDEEAIVAAVRQAQRFAAPTMQATFSKPSPDKLQVSLTGALRSKVESTSVDVMVALYESGLVTKCESGENKDRMLKNDHVIRRLEKLCSPKDISAKKNLSGSVQFSLWDGFEPAKCGVVAFVQNSSLQILGVQHFQIPDSV